jgi:predicted RNase H-like HicB family nuclease
MRSRGSHRHFKHPTRALLITVPGNDGKELAPGTLNDILRKAGFKMNDRRYPVIIEQTSTGYSAYSPDVTGCAAAGDTREETRRNFEEALSAHFEVMREIGEPIPSPTASVEYVEVAA